ncbi:hypothetical protein FDG95_gp581 [Pectobacterium phage vB_PcaM_CBB]|uniref:Uncharacterized protein n=1 Tax=Pectobacterium phage vB_PcaM_CBB TaxID=2772511 RepID=A0A1L2CVB0_9CAUD|nr:hypothetical protein FDG95_gp581 [Pectobacterium phage vB_PcaM_CBB]AMM43961.1 hypothetical protein CBB_398 [Pectobacterium phage vB_PcaM_CBB]
MAKKIELLSFRNIIDKANELIDSNPILHQERDDECKITVPNPTNIGYDELWEIWGYERFVRIKFRDPDQLIEYQIDLLPWNMSVNYNIWNDNKNSPSSMVRKIHIKFTDTEEEYFQRMTQQDNSFFTMEELRDAKLLMKRVYEYFNITPVPQEQ